MAADRNRVCASQDGMEEERKEKGNALLPEDS